MKNHTPDKLKLFVAINSIVFFINILIWNHYRVAHINGAANSNKLLICFILNVVIVVFSTFFTRKILRTFQSPLKKWVWFAISFAPVLFFIIREVVEKFYRP